MTVETRAEGNDQEDQATRDNKRRRCETHGPPHCLIMARSVCRAADLRLSRRYEELRRSQRAHHEAKDDSSQCQSTYDRKHCPPEPSVLSLIRSIGPAELGGVWLIVPWGVLLDDVIATAPRFGGASLYSGLHRAGQVSQAKAVPIGSLSGWCSLYARSAALSRCTTSSMRGHDKELDPLVRHDLESLTEGPGEGMKPSGFDCYVLDVLPQA